MDIIITEKPKKLRRNKDNTQEQLVNHMNISIQVGTGEKHLVHNEKEVLFS